ncbi:hypothetical protein [Nocardia carnea]|uniref:hypothetical protein n=1 Tax=Nocardia carnea TaxID=37328 RepID=UPI0024547A3F|nr:hypothetical protein [Nocardia carnea]
MINVANTSAFPIDRIRACHGGAVHIGTGCDIANDVQFIIDRDATITLGNRVSIRRGTTLHGSNGRNRADFGDVSDIRSRSITRTGTPIGRAA